MGGLFSEFYVLCCKKLFLPREKAVFLEDNMIKIAWRSHEFCSRYEFHPYHDFSLEKWQGASHFLRTGD